MTDNIQKKPSSNWLITNVIRRIDRFGKNVPAFNIDGHDQVSTLVGGLLSITIRMLALGYGLTTLLDLIDKQNPTINQYHKASSYGPNDELDFKEFSFKFAVGVEGYFDRKPRHDPRYVKWLARVYYYDNADDSFKQTILPLHPCTSKDYDEFYPIN